jgi:hypothetical protein
VGSIVVADEGNHRIRLISQACIVATLAGSTRGFQDGQGAGAQFNNPAGVAVDCAGNVLVVDLSNRRIRRIAANLPPPTWPDQEATPPPVPVFNMDVGKLLDQSNGDELFHDVSFQIEGDIVHANKCILSARCEYFATMLTSSFAEGERGSGTDAPLRVADTTPAAFRALLAYLYTDTVELDDASVIDVACLSQRYLVTTLHEACVAYCTEHASLANSIGWLVTVDVNKLEDLRAILLDYVMDNYAEIKATYPNTLDILMQHPRLMFDIMGSLTSPPTAKRRKTSHGK